MKRALVTAAAVLAVAVLAGCSTWCRTGDPGCLPQDSTAVNTNAFDCVQPGMTRGEVVTMLGSPVNTAQTWMHWQQGVWGDAWVFLDDNGTRVTGKYRQDEDTLRLSDVPPYGD